MQLSHQLVALHEQNPFVRIVETQTNVSLPALSHSQSLPKNQNNGQQHYLGKKRGRKPGPASKLNKNNCGVSTKNAQTKGKETCRCLVCSVSFDATDNAKFQSFFDPAKMEGIMESVVKLLLGVNQEKAREWRQNLTQPISARVLPFCKICFQTAHQMWGLHSQLELMQEQISLMVSRMKGAIWLSLRGDVGEDTQTRFRAAVIRSSEQKKVPQTKQTSSSNVARTFVTPKLQIQATTAFTSASSSLANNSYPTPVRKQVISKLESAVVQKQNLSYPPLHPLMFCVKRRPGRPPNPNKSSLVISNTDTKFWHPPPSSELPTVQKRGPGRPKSNKRRGRPPAKPIGTIHFPSPSVTITVEKVKSDKPQPATATTSALINHTSANPYKKFFPPTQGQGIKQIAEGLIQVKRPYKKRKYNVIKPKNSEKPQIVSSVGTQKRGRGRPPKKKFIDPETFQKLHGTVNSFNKSLNNSTTAANIEESEGVVVKVESSFDADISDYDYPSDGFEIVETPDSENSLTAVGSHTTLSSPIFGNETNETVTEVSNKDPKCVPSPSKKLKVVVDAPIHQEAQNPTGIETEDVMDFVPVPAVPEASLDSSSGVQEICQIDQEEAIFTPLLPLALPVDQHNSEVFTELPQI